MKEWIDLLNAYVWSDYLIYLCLGIGVYFSFRTRFLQVRHLKAMIKLLTEGKSSKKGVSSFQALAVSISGRVGTGNIAGVASAIAFGGPGAIFWMWVIAFLGAGSAFVESTLAQIYKIDQDGQYRGGPAYYIELGLRKKWYAVLFACATIIATGLFLPGVQSNSIAAGLKGAFGVDPSITSVLLVVLLSGIIFGGMKRISHVAEFVVPFMAITYIVVSLSVIFMNISALPEIFTLIIKSAFAFDATFGGMVGAAIAFGVKRGIYSNEAGQGTGPHPAAAAEVSHPAKQGLVQAFSVYIDTLFICTATALMILITGKYNVTGPDGQVILNQIGDIAAGPIFTQMAVESVFSGFGSPFIAISLLFFAFTTIMAYYYIAETNVAYLSQTFDSKILINVLRLMLLGSVAYGAVKTADIAWGLGDLGVGMMAWLNIVAIFLLKDKALLALKDYENQKALGRDPVFQPSKLGISHAPVWDGVASDKKENKRPAAHKPQTGDFVLQP